MSYRIFPFLNPETIKNTIFWNYFLQFLEYDTFLCFPHAIFHFLRFPNGQPVKSQNLLVFSLHFCVKMPFQIDGNKGLVNCRFLFLCFITWTSCATCILIADCQRVQKSRNKLYKKRPINFIQTVQCIIGCTTEFTTLYKGRLLLLRLLCIAITSTTNIDALLMIGFLFFFWGP